MQSSSIVNDEFGHKLAALRTSATERQMPPQKDRRRNWIESLKPIELNPTELKTAKIALSKHI